MELLAVATSILKSFHPSTERFDFVILFDRKIFGHRSINQSSGIFWNEVHGMSCRSHHLAYVVFDRLLMVLKGD